MCFVASHLLFDYCLTPPFLLFLPAFLKYEILLLFLAASTHCELCLIFDLLKDSCRWRGILSLLRFSFVYQA